MWFAVSPMMGGVIDRAGLADFLRRRRELLRPVDVGLPDGVRRRTPGLRRDEVAQLAGMSTDYYSRLEQARGSHPSEPIVAALARVLRCDLDQRDHLFYLAGFTPPPRRAGRHIRPGLISLVDHLTDVPVWICTDLDEVLWQNPLADALIGPVDPRGGRAGNFTWRWFMLPGARDRFPESEWRHHSLAHVNDLRATYSRRAGNPEVVMLVHDLLEHSTEFAELWERHEVSVRRHDRKQVMHPEVGLLHLTCEVLLTPDEDIKVLAFFPIEGTGTREKLDLLRVVGTQEFQTTT